MAPLLKHNSELLFVTPDRGRGRFPPNLRTLEGRCHRGACAGGDACGGYGTRRSPPQDLPTPLEFQGIWGEQSSSSEVTSFWSLWSRDHKPSSILELNARTMKNKENGFLCYIRVLAGRQAIQGPVLLSKHLQDHLKTKRFYSVKTNRVLEDNSIVPACQATMWLEKVFQRETMRLLQEQRESSIC